MSERKSNSTSGTSEVYRIPPNHYVHVLNQNTNVTRVETGPLTYVCKDHEEVVFGPSKMVIIPPRHFAEIENPVKREKESNEPLMEEKTGQILLEYGKREYRLKQEPFPLFPGEVLQGRVSPLKMLMKNEALRLRCLEDFDDRTAGEEWLFEGPGLYVPHVCVEELNKIQAWIIKEGQALQLVATQNTVDRDGTPRVAGEEWLVKRVGAYLPGVFEKVVRVVDAIVLSDTQAIHMVATKHFTDEFKQERFPGEEWLITKETAESYIPSVNERKIRDVSITILSSRQYCVILNPYQASSRKNKLGAKKLVRGPASFFLHPKEELLRGVENVHVLSEEMGLIVSANKAFDDRKPGERWMVRGPMEYVPPVEASVIKEVRAIALDNDEGVYVRNMQSGEVRAVIGETVMLDEHETLWEKELPSAIEKLLIKKGTFDDSRAMRVRDKTKVIRYRVPHNSAVQIYDYKERQARVVFGPKLVMLQPDEIFTPLSLSGGKPKKPNQIRALHLLLGPDFSTDIITVETSDHARLNLRLSYNWRFDLSRFESEEEATALFSVADFVGDACNAMASRIRGAIASQPFDEFHKKNAKIIRTAVFGEDEAESFSFPANGLLITEVDIQEIEPVDKKTSEALQSAVQLAIQITTDSQEAAARQEASRMDQEATGKLERSKIGDNCEAEKARKTLIELQAQTRAVETAGLAIAEARGKAEAARIQAMASVEEAKLLAKAKEVEVTADIEATTQKQDAELKFLGQMNELESEHERKMGEIEIEKFKSMIEAIGPNIIQNLALSRPQNEVTAIQQLKLQSTLITDGKSPVNLLAAAQKMIARPEEEYDSKEDDEY